MTSVDSILQAHASEIEAALRSALPALAVTYLTPRYATSRNVIGLASDGDGRVHLVAKLARDAADQRLCVEADVLRLIERLAPAATGIPRLVLLTRASSSTALVETAVHGRQLTRRELREARDHWAGVVVEWGRPLWHVDHDSVRTAVPSVRGVLDEALHAWSAVGGERPDIADIVHRTAELTAALDEVRAPLAIEHGDLAPPNLLVDGAGRLGVVDWELSRLSPVPLHDLAFFVSHLAWIEVDGPDDRRLERLDNALRGGGWARGVLERRAAELDLKQAEVMPLVLACWARYAAGTLERVRDAGRIGTEATTIVEAVRRMRPFVIWRHLAERLASGTLS